MHCGGCAGLARWLIAACSVGVSVCASVGLLGSAPAKERPTRPPRPRAVRRTRCIGQSGSRRRHLYLSRDASAPSTRLPGAARVCPKARRGQGTTVSDGLQPQASFLFGVSSSQVVIAMAKIANAERRVGLRPAAGGDLILSAVAGRENLCSLAHMEVACGARCAAWCALVVLWRWSHLASCAATRLFSQVFKTRRAM